MTVVQDVNLNNERDGLDQPIENVLVRVFDVDGNGINLRTDAAGVATLSGADNTLAGGQYRVEVTNPNGFRFSEAQISDGHSAPEFAPAVSFVDTRDGKAADISVGYVDYTTLGVDGARIYSAVQPDDVWEPNSGEAEVYSAPYNLSAGATPVTTNKTIGSVYGIGLDDESLDIYAGAYAKRGSLYGPGGSGAIYRVSTVTGEWEVYTTVANTGDTEHNIGPLLPSEGFVHHDYDFRTAVGREALGDVEVSDDNRFLTTVNLNTDSLVVYPVQEGLNPAPIQTLAVAQPATCVSDWSPMALAEQGSSLFVGAVCGSDLETYVFEYTRAADGTLSSAPVSTRQGQVALTEPRAGQNGPDSGFLMAQECQLVDWRVWTDDVPQECVDKSTLNSPGRPLNQQFVVPQPMFGDIDFLENGDMITSFRDRSGDQYGWSLYIGEQTDGDLAYGNVIATGDIVALAGDGATLDFANPLYDFQDRGFTHNQSAFSGIATVPGSGTIVSSMMDPTNAILQNGLRAFDDEDGSHVASINVTGTFAKAMGLADLEALVQEQTQQIGNRIWLDTDKDGVQDPGEPSIAGVQVSLYDSEGTLIATTETDENGEYWFDTADGLLPSTQYEVRLDRETDFEAGGPLAGYEPTLFGRGGAGIDSNGVESEGTILATVTSPAAGRNDHSTDFGFVPTPVSVGDYVWFDADSDGVQDEDEEPVGGVEVILYGPDGEEVDRTTTNGNGFYSFTDLDANTEYTIEFPTTATIDDEEFPLTVPNAGTDDALDSDADRTTGRVTFTTPLTGENSGLPDRADLPTIDAGYGPKIPSVSVGDFVWIDSDGDGVQDAGEPGIEGVTLTLTGPDGQPVTGIDGQPVAPVETDASGKYSFDGLPVLAPGESYTVTVTPPAGYSPTTAGAGDPATDSSTGSAESGDLTEDGASDVTLDFGFVPTLVSVGDYVWIDADADGIQDAGESPVPGAPVKLFDAAGELVAETTTDENGFYAFTGLTPSTDYVVEFPTTVTVGGKEYPLTQPGQGADAGADSNPNQSTGRAPVTTPATGSNSGAPGQADVPTIDAGYVPVVEPSVSVGDFVWIDSDGDGVQDAGEPGIEGVTLTLTGPDGQPVTGVDGEPVAPVKTDASGKYSFDGLPVLAPGESYTVTVTPPAGYAPTTAGAGDPATDSSTGSAESGDLTEDGASDVTLDFGFVPVVEPELVSVGDYVWIDADGDGVQDAGESPVPGVAVKLFDAAGELVAETTTDENGFYAFTDLKPSTDYVVEFPTTVTVDGTEYPLTQQGAGSNAAADSNPNQSTGRAPVTTPATGNNSGEPGQADVPTIDAGYVPVAPPTLVSVGDFVWIDADGDGVQDAGESPVPGASVKLFDAAGELVAETTTDENGFYAFTDLKSDTEYKIVFPKSVTVDGTQYPLTEQGAGSDNAADSNPGADGGYVFTTPATGNNSGEPGQADDPTIDAGYAPIVEPTLVSIGDYVWIDADGDGVQDAGETPAPGVPVKLFDAAGELVAETTTDENGFYAFTDLKPSTDYVVEFPTTVTVDGTEYPLTQPGQGADTAVDSNPSQSTGRTPVTTPPTGSNSGAPGQTDDPTIDAGYAPVVEPELVSVGDYVWIDADGDGVQDAGESPVPGATVKLFDAAGELVAETTTDENGFYAFTDLKPGAEYKIVFPTTVTVDGKEYPLTKQGAGSDTGADSNPGADGGYVFTAPATGNNSGEPGQADDPTIDAGYAPVVEPTLVSVGDYVWIDADGDGVQDAGESPAPGVSVKLFDAAGELVAETTTDENGFYVFTDLKPNTEYKIVFPTTVTVDGKEYPLTKQGAGSDTGADSNPGADGGYVFTTPATGNNSGEPGQADDPTIDAGFAPVIEPTPTPTPVDPTPTPTPVDPTVTPTPGNPTPAPTTPGDDGLATTGAETLLPIGGIALALLLGGAVVLLVKRRTQQ